MITIVKMELNTISWKLSMFELHSFSFKKTKEKNKILPSSSASREILWLPVTEQYLNQHARKLS